MALITCPECGNQISDQARVCPHCGVPLNSYPQQQYVTSSGGSGRPGWLIPVLIAAVVALLAILGYIAYSNSHQSQDNLTTNASTLVTNDISQADQAVQAPAESQPKSHVEYRDPSTLVRYCINTINYGYVRVRKRPSKSSGVVKTLYDGDAFYGHPMRTTNWIEYVENGRVIGYVREDVVRKPGQSRYFDTREDYENGYWY